MLVATLNTSLPFLSFSSFSSCDTIVQAICSYPRCSNVLFPYWREHKLLSRSLICLASSKNAGSSPVPNPSQNPDSKPKKPNPRTRESKAPKDKDKNLKNIFPTTIPKKPRRGRRSEAAAVEDFIRDSLERTFASIKEQDFEILKDKESIIKERVDEESGSDHSSDDEDHGNGSREKNMVMEEEDPNWPLDADVGWGIRASEYFEQHPIRNVVGEDGVEIDWEGEIDYGLVKEINCLEWESFAFRPSPLIVLVFERYNRASENWKVLKELEKAAEVFWKAKDRLPPRTVKLDINIERDLAYALKVKECPQILFLRGNRILYREKEPRRSDELVQMIAHFYYNAKKPMCINDAFLSPPC
ncbi:thioredoxin-like fold domain-containing protein MRL7 homolog, chloroplastic [Coffea arabica]|uniref:Thioredoxin-like fold domain-containing protein MRL7 homolog, chloroplastic n=1 Tax=Coffea arabica TaxID=13443 RepID=A0A6P6W8J1_COFAR|nr:thioredoxin-like fold domain-containing protein MRL7 homolog, chloroplastic [Coffea arabica]XP_027111620.1 thioredoxin-like fold domain-containing protein MRL7 homolog, chloroplastic [Coffea arabica]XP_027111621.1 thioredoxin-like fold domain-containing protein MRL7 homolog, chloroplastic [Coffea arabica]XP_027111622.1 thioredoxin-like fold domain-containing protein MRL7 homolog, chloroplastic [Coffea arabica]XP_027111623.1 thioredoxin-like fold domain-containing protein MRL7 homolog, chloro